MTNRKVRRVGGYFGYFLITQSLKVPAMNATERKNSLVHVVVLAGLFLALFTQVAIKYNPNTFLFRDGSFYAQTNRAIVEGLTLRQEAFQPKSWYDGSLPWYQNVDDAWSNISVGKNGEWYPKHSWLMPVFSTPFYLVSGPLGLLFFNLLMMVLGLYASYRIAARFYGTAPAAVAIIIISFAPVVPYLTYSYSHDVFYATLIAGGFALLLFNRPILGGALLGLSLVAKITNAVIVLPISIAIVIGNPTVFFRALIAGAVPLASFAIANWYMYGAPWITSYHRILTVSNGVPEIVSYNNAFDLPFAEGVKRYFSVSNEGEVWHQAYIPILAYLGVIALFFRAPVIATGLLVGVIGFLVAFAKYRYGGARFFMTNVFLAAIPLTAGICAIAGAIRNGVDFYAKHRPSPKIAWLVGLVIFLAHVVGFGLAWTFGHHSDDPASMTRDVEKLEVHHGSANCDYFNMADWKWECSGIDRGNKEFTGLAIRNECAEFGSSAITIPTAAGRTSTVTWRPDVDINRAVLLHALESGARELSFFVEIAGSAPFEVISKPGSASRTALAPVLKANTAVTIRMADAPKGAHVCVDITSEKDAEDRFK